MYGECGPENPVFTIKTTLFYSNTNITLADLQQESSYVQRAVKAHIWAKKVVQTGSTKLVGTAPQVRIQMYSSKLQHLIRPSFESWRGRALWNWASLNSTARAITGGNNCNKHDGVGTYGGSSN